MTLKYIRDFIQNHNQKLNTIIMSCCKLLVVIWFMAGKSIFLRCTWNTREYVQKRYGLNSPFRTFQVREQKIVIPSLPFSCPWFSKASLNSNQSRIYISAHYILSDSYESPTASRCISIEYKPLWLNMQKLKNQKAQKQATSSFFSSVKLKKNPNNNLFPNNIREII